MDTQFKIVKKPAILNHSAKYASIKNALLELDVDDCIEVPLDYFGRGNASSSLTPGGWIPDGKRISAHAIGRSIFISIVDKNQK